MAIVCPPQVMPNGCYQWVKSRMRMVILRPIRLSMPTALLSHHLRAARGQPLPDAVHPRLVLGLHQHRAQASDQPGDDCRIGAGCRLKPCRRQLHQRQMQIPRGAGGKNLLRQFGSQLWCLGVHFPHHNVEFRRSGCKRLEASGLILAQPPVQVREPPPCREPARGQTRLPAQAAKAAAWPTKPPPRLRPANTPG